MAQDIFDLVILGAGPAGITAAVYAARKGLKFRMVTLDIGGQAGWSGDIENYTGYQFLTGPELVAKFQEHMDHFGIDVSMPEKVVGFKKEQKLIKITTDKDEYLAKTVIIATGKRSRKLGLDNEDQLRNRGVTYCATCDGPLFKGKVVAVIGGGNSALDAALQLVGICPKVYLINISDKLTGDKVMIDKLEKAANVEIINQAKVSKIYADNFVNAIEIITSQGSSKILLSGIFVEIGLVPNSEFASIVNKNSQQEIIIDQENKTNVKGIFAAGDVTNVIEKQIIIACGEGSKAALSAFRYLSTNNF